MKNEPKYYYDDSVIMISTSKPACHYYNINTS